MKIVVIGGGATSIAVVHHLVHYCISYEINNLSIILVSSQSMVGAGKAYSSRIHSHKLNTLPYLMSIDPEKPNSFIEWLQGERAMRHRRYFVESNLENIFLPRILFYKYIKDSLIEVVNLAKGNGISVDIKIDEAVDIRILKNKKHVTLKSKEEILSDYVIYAPGIPKASRFKSFEKNINFVSNPYNVHRIKNIIKQGKNIAVIGSGLTAIDTIYTLLEMGYSKPIYLFSRRGFLPTVNKGGQQKEHFNLIFSKRNLTLVEIIRKIHQELKNKEGSECELLKYIDCSKEHVAYISTLIKQAEKNNLPLQDLLFSLRNQWPELWLNLPHVERKIFRKKIHHIWNIYRHPIPLSTAKFLLKLLKKKTVVIESGLHHINDRNGEFVLCTKNDYFEFQSIIDASGSDSNITKSESKLDQKLLKRGLATPNPNGGINITRDFELLGRSGVSKEIFAVGPIVQGELLSTNAFWFNCEIAKRIAQNIIEDIDQKPAFQNVNAIYNEVISC